MVHSEIKNKYHQKKRKTATIEKLSFEKIDFLDIYNYYNINCIHRNFCYHNIGSDDGHISLLAMFCVFEFLHNFNMLIENYNKLPKIENITYNVFGWYETAIKSLENGKIYVRPDVWTYVLKNNKREEIEKQAAQEALDILSSHKNILSKIKQFINDYKTVKQ